MHVLSYKHITVAKLVCIALLFCPLWGLLWFRVNINAHWIFSDWITLLKNNKSASVIYIFVCLFALISFICTAFVRNNTARILLMIVMLAAWALELFLLDMNGTLSNQNIF